MNPFINDKIAATILVYCYLPNLSSITHLYVKGYVLVKKKQYVC